jgi:hypothetical protein
MTVVLPWPKNGHNASHATTTSSTSSSLCSSSRLSSSTAPSSAMEQNAPIQTLKPLPALEMADPTLHPIIPTSPATPLPITARSVSLSRRNHSAENHQHTFSGSSTPDESSQRKARKVLGNYTLSKTLGAGSMGKVKLAVHGITGHKVLPCVFYDVGSYHVCILNSHTHTRIYTLSLSPTFLAGCQDHSKSQYSSHYGTE